MDMLIIYISFNGPAMELVTKKVSVQSKPSKYCGGHSPSDL